MVHGTLTSNDIHVYVYEVSSNRYHLLKSFAVDKKMLRTEGNTSWRGHKKKISKKL